MDINEPANHISKQFNEDMDVLRNLLMSMGGLVERQVVESIHALLSLDHAEAEAVRQRESHVDDFEVRIDEECTRVLVRRQPAASDLRLIMTVSKTTRDLERIGDEAYKIAKMAIKLSEDGLAPKSSPEIRHMGNLVIAMVRDTLDAFARSDAKRALDVVESDSEVDQEHDSVMRALVTHMMEDPRSISRVLNIIWSIRALERIGDHARNIAEHTIYMVKGEDVRHAPLIEVERTVRQ